VAILVFKDISLHEASKQLVQAKNLKTYTETILLLKDNKPSKTKDDNTPLTEEEIEALRKYLE